MAKDYSSWLPSLEPFSYDTFKGDWSAYLDYLFKIFKRDFIDSKPFYQGKPIVFDNGIQDQKPRGFWHLVSDSKSGKGDYEESPEEREWSLLRCERIAWIRAIIENHTDSAVSAWPNKRKGKKGTCFLLEKEDFLIVLRDGRNVYVLVSSYYLRSHTKNKVIKERDKYYKAKTVPDN